MSELVIQTEGLQKVYGKKTVVSDLSLQVAQGEVFGFLGPNGAGKSTSVKMLLGLVAPSSGKATVLGQPPGHITTMAHIGFLPEHFRFHEWLQAQELLDMYGRLYRMDKATRNKRIPELLELVRLSEHAHRPIAGFSKGMLQRIGLAQALLNYPRLVFLDEPTSALDPFGRMLVRTIIHDVRSQGTTVFLNSHLLSEVEATCNKVAFIRDGRILRSLNLNDFEPSRLVVEVRVNEITPALLALLRKVLANDGEITMDGQHRDDTKQLNTLELILKSETLLPIIAQSIVEHGTQLYALVPRRTSLEQLFLEIVGTQDSGQ